MKPPDDEALSKGISRDMSPMAIAERLRIASDLYDFARCLSTAKYLGKVESPKDELGDDQSRATR